MAEHTERKERDRQRHRTEILDAAEAIFAEKGFLRATVEEIAAKTGFSVGSLYNLFGSKEDLYLALIETRAHQLAVDANAAFDQIAQPADFPDAYITLRIDLATKYEPFFRLWARERMGDRFASTPLWIEKLAPLLNPFLQRLTDAFAQGQRDGVFRSDVDPADLTLAVDGLCDAFMFEWLAGDDPNLFARKRESMLQLFLQGANSRS